MPRTERRIADHAVIGDLTTMALVALDGAIDFLCWPGYDSPSLFAALLDPERGGAFELAPRIEDPRVFQRYIADSNVVVTTWLGDQVGAEITDFMPVTNPDARPRLIRRCTVTRGEVGFRLRCAPGFNYARSRATVELAKGAATFRCPEHADVRVDAVGGVRLSLDGDAVVATFVIREGEHVDFVLQDAEDPVLTIEQIAQLQRDTIGYWQSWVHRSSYTGRWRDTVVRSALVLKLMTSRHSGAIVAAPTFGLPEAPGGARNWDYRATWVRDASFSVYALLRLGHREEAMAFMRWMAERVTECDTGRLKVMYAVDGTDVGEEVSLDHLAGYDGSKPVRIGNGAADQLQLDIYGALLDAIYLTNKYGAAISQSDWQGVRRVVDYVCENWQLPDSGIWEVRAEATENLHSRLMCWVAIDRAIRLAEKRSLSAPFGRWIEARNAINDDIWANFFDKERGHFVRSRGATDLDGALLMMPLVRFVGATDPAWVATLDAIDKELADNALVMRYDRKDGLEGVEGSFAACAFWRVECLARAGRLDEARDSFEKLLSYGNHVRLFSEEFGQRAELLGNFPQALTHLALISAAYCLDRALDGKAERLWPA